MTNQTHSVSGCDIAEDFWHRLLTFCSNSRPNLVVFEVKSRISTKLTHLSITASHTLKTLNQLNSKICQYKDIGFKRWYAHDAELVPNTPLTQSLAAAVLMSTAILDRSDLRFVKHALVCGPFFSAWSFYTAQHAVMKDCVWLRNALKRRGLC